MNIGLLPPVTKKGEQVAETNYHEISRRLGIVYVNSGYWLSSLLFFQIELISERDHPAYQIITVGYLYYASHLSLPSITDNILLLEAKFSQR